MSVIEILESAQKVCTTWRRVYQDPAMWRVIEIRPPNCTYERHELIAMCCNAKDRSQGQATDIFVEYFGDNQLINYISRRFALFQQIYSSQTPYTVKLLGYIRRIKKFPKLEELNHIQMSIEPKDIESIGISCPAMKSFTYSVCRLKFPAFYESDKRYNEYAAAIAKNMPNLRHLVANTLNSTGLEEILHGCPQLESLDIRQCFNVYFGGDLGKRCREQIKHLKLPWETIDNYEFYDDDYQYGGDDIDVYDDDYFSS